MFLIVMYACGVLSVIGILYMLFIEPFNGETVKSTQASPPKSDSLVSRVESNSIIVPDHEVSEPKEVKRTRRLKPGTTDISVSNPERIEALKRLEIETMKKIKRSK